MKFKSLSRSKVFPFFAPLPAVGREQVVALIPAHNEAASIAATIEGILSQERLPTRTVVICDNCTDNTYEIASTYSEITVIETVDNTHRKSGALNLAWLRYAQQADIIICLDADTILPPNAIKDWVQEFQDDSELGGSSSKFTMRGEEFLVALQRAEFSKWTDSALKRGWTSVLAGTGCAIRNSVLRKIVKETERDGPWTDKSLVEDFELTHRIRELGFYCRVSETVRAYTDSMKTIKSLWAQRMKWQAGTVADLLSMGITRTTLLDWIQQLNGLAIAFARFLWIFFMVFSILTHHVYINLWMFAPTVIFIANDIKQSLRIPHKTKKDVLLAAVLLPQEAFAWMRAAWFFTAWGEVLIGKITKKKKDRWAMQYSAEASTVEISMISVADECESTMQEG